MVKPLACCQRWGAGLLLLGLSACNFAPVYQRPKADLKPTWTADAAAPRDRKSTRLNSSH